jgi:hypothetical protein
MDEQPACRVKPLRLLGPPYVSQIKGRLQPIGFVGEFFPFVRIKVRKPEGPHWCGPFLFIKKINELQEELRNQWNSWMANLETTQNQSDTGESPPKKKWKPSGIYELRLPPYPRNRITNAEWMI